MKTLTNCKFKVLGKKYIPIIAVNKINPKKGTTNWFKKWKGINWGILILKFNISPPLPSIILDITRIKNTVYVIQHIK